MKKLSDYKGEEAIELWADLMGPLSEIMADPEVQKTIQGNSTPIGIATNILKNQKEKAMEMLLRIDDTPIDGLNFIQRVVSFVSEIMGDKAANNFLSQQGQKEE